MDIDISCPACGRMDWVQSVPAIRATGVQTITGTDYYSGVGLASSGFIPVIGSATIERTQTSSLARTLPLTPLQRTSGRPVMWGLIMAIPFLIAVAPLTISVLRPQPDVGWGWTLVGALFFLGAFATPSAIAFAIAVHRIRLNNRISRGLPTARAVWSAGKYCHGCGLCFWPYSPAPNVPARKAMPPNNFTWVVWNVGGYANI
ncbi:hypothetical protein [Nocardia sp. NPDC052112]|uniref:hypothetical protein n=1 Tax=Nocardia sp. NPDC052112 TaxID=3155646 RepID=UPI00342A0A63